jgi:hypothetical protein
MKHLIATVILLLAATAAHADTQFYDKNGQYVGRAVENPADSFRIKPPAPEAPLPVYIRTEEPASPDFSGLSTLGASDSGLQFKTDAPPTAVIVGTVAPVVPAVEPELAQNTPGYVDPYRILEQYRKEKAAK